MKVLSIPPFDPVQKRKRVVYVFFFTLIKTLQLSPLLKKAAAIRTAP